MHRPEMDRNLPLDVLVVGAGPVGLTLASELIRRGVRVRIIDKASAPATTSRALGLQPRTLELFDTMGIVDLVLATGGPVFGANLYDGDRVLLSFDGARADGLFTPYPHVWVTPQTSVEGPLTERLAELGGYVERGRELIDLSDDGSIVRATIRASGGTGRDEEIQATWVVGCDGAHSHVRKRLGLSFTGSTYPERFLLADVEVRWDKSRERTHAWFPPEGMFVVFPLPGSQLWRMFAVLETSEAPSLTLELFQNLFRERTGDVTTVLANPTWMSAFTINRRMVDRYRVGRVFVAGDAAHVHSPFGAQGMNTGIQDAFNLAWKLALVSTQGAPDQLLDTYDAERRPVARRVLGETDRNTRAFLSDHPVIRFVREHILTLDPVQSYLARRSSQLLVNYRESPLSQSASAQPTGVWFQAAPDPRPGDRAPDGEATIAGDGTATTLFHQFRGTHFTLLLFAGIESQSPDDLATAARQAQRRLGLMVRTVVIGATEVEISRLDNADVLLVDQGGDLHHRYGAVDPVAILVRPDGYIGFRSRPAASESLGAYLDRWFRKEREGGAWHPNRLPDDGSLVPMGTS